VLLKDEEGHTDWLEVHILHMDEMGYERYLSMQAGEENS
jgi:bacterioferritin (cytochrome b1)